MITIARVIITILLLPFFILMLGIVTFIAMYEIFWHGHEWKAKTEGPDKI